MAKMVYPKAPRVEMTENIHGVEIADPFRPLEDPHADDTKKWIDEQVKVADTYFAGIGKREVFSERVIELYNARQVFPPMECGGYVIYEQRFAGQNQPIFYRSRLDRTEETIILDPNSLSDDGTVAVSQVTPTVTCSHIAYEVSSSGSDWSEIFIRDLRTGLDLSDKLRYIKFSAISWLKDGSGFFYTRLPVPDEKTKYEDVSKDMKLFLHRLGTDQQDDQLVFHPDDPEVFPQGSVTDDGKYLVITCFRGAGSTDVVYVKSIGALGEDARPIIDKFHSVYGYIGNRDEHFYFLTSHGAPRRHIVAIDVSQEEILEKIVVSESEATLEGGVLATGRFILKYLRDARSELRVYAETGAFSYQVELPDIGTVTSVTAEDQKAETVFFGFETFTSPLAIFSLSVATGVTSPWGQIDNEIDESRFETRQVFCQSKDGTKVPIFLAGRKDVLNKTCGGEKIPCPLLLYGYGGFNISMQPGFNVSRFAFMELGGIYAVANIRGGNEYGEEWHAAGIREKKQNVFDDFIGAGEFLIREGYTEAAKLAIMGGSNGGLLVGACITQRPGLFRAAIAGVGVLDMLRFHKFTVGWAWIGEYGDPDNQFDFRYLIEYSPLHNIKNGTQYPSTLITTGDHDDRVVPAHSYKFAAALQEAHHGERPILIRIDKNAGHGEGKPINKQVLEATDVLSFLWQELGMGETN